MTGQAGSAHGAEVARCFSPSELGTHRRLLCTERPGRGGIQPGGIHARDSGLWSELDLRESLALLLELIEGSEAN